MQNKKSIPLIVLAIFGMALLLSYDNLPAVYAVEFDDITTNDQPDFVYTYSSGVTNYLAVGTGGASPSIQVYNLDNGALIRTISLTSISFSGTLVDMYCQATLCWALFDSSPDNIAEINIATGSAFNGYNFSSITAGGALVASGTIEATIFLFTTDGSETYYRVLSTSTVPYTLVNTVDTNVGNNGVLDAERITSGGINYLVFTTQAGSLQYRVWNLGTSASVCSATISTAAFDIFHMSGDTVYISDNEEVEIFDLACNDDGTIANTQLCDQGGTEPTRGLSGSVAHNEVYVMCDQNTSNPRVVIINVTSNTRLGTLVLSSATSSPRHDTMSYNSDSDTLSVVMNAGDKARIFYFSGIGGGGGLNGSENGVCLNVDANGDGHINVLDCVGSNTAWAGITGGQNATDITKNITDGLGLTHCGEDGDPETCGSGLFMFIFLLLLMEFLSLAGYLGFTSKIGAEKQIADVAIIMLIIAFACIAIAFYLNWIPDIVFYAIVVLIAGFTTFGILHRIRGG